MHLSNILKCFNVFNKYLFEYDYDDDGYINYFFVDINEETERALKQLGEEPNREDYYNIKEVWHNLNKKYDVNICYDGEEFFLCL